MIGSAAVGALLSAQLTDKMPAAASKAAQALPEQFRPQFVSGLQELAAAGAEVTGGAQAPIPASVPAQARPALAAAFKTAFDNGFTNAMRPTLRPADRDHGPRRAERAAGQAA